MSTPGSKRESQRHAHTTTSNPFHCLLPPAARLSFRVALNAPSVLFFPLRFLRATPVQVNLGDAVLRGLFSRWIDQHLRLDGEGMASSRRRGVGGGNGGAYSSGESDSEDSDRGRGSDYESRSTSPGSGLSSQASAGEREGGGRRGGALRQAGSGSIRGNHVLDIDLAGGGGGLGGGRAIGDDTVLWVTETDLGGSGGLQRTLLQKRVGEFDGREVSAPALSMSLFRSPLYPREFCICPIMDHRTLGL